MRHARRSRCAARRRRPSSSPTSPRPTLVAHRHGAAGEAWREAVRRADRRLGELLDAAAPERAIIVMADHGTTRRGGHAGGEAVVRRAPLVIVPAGAGAAGRERGPGERFDPYRLVRASLFAASEAASGRAANAAETRGANATSPRADALAAGLGGLAVLGVLLAIGGAAGLAREPGPGFGASAALWIAIAMTVAGRAEIGAALVIATSCVLGALALGGGGYRTRLPSAGGLVRGPPAGPLPDPALDVVVGTLSGIALAALGVVAAERLADAAPLAADWRWALTVPVGLAGGALAARVRSPRVAGIALAVALAVAVHAGGETSSLSSVDVRAAHRVAGLLDGGAGIALAAPVALLRLALPIVAVLLGYRLGRRGRPGGGDRDLAPARSFGGCQLGAAVVYGICLSRPVESGGVMALPLVASGFGALLREAMTSCLVFVALVLGASAGGARRGRRAGPAAS